MKKLFTIILLIITTFIYSNTIVDKNGIDGVLIRTITFIPGDKEYDSLYQMELVYNSKGNISSRKLLFNEQYAKQSDMVSQEEIYNQIGIVEKYIILFTDDYYFISGLKKQIERVDNNDNITDIEYYTSEKYLFKEKNQNRQSKFPFYKITYLKKIMFEDYLDNPKGTNYGISMRYKSATSLITFLEEPVNMDDKDRDFLTFYCKSKNAENLISLYSKKVLVQEENIKYYVMFQDQLLEYVKVNEKAAINHYFGTRDKEIMIICVGFTDIH